MSNRVLIYRKSRGVNNMWNYDGMPEIESCVNIPEVEERAREQWVKMNAMVREHDNMNLQRSWSVKRPEVYRQNIVSYTVLQMLTIRLEWLVTANDDPSYRMSICRRRHGPPTPLECEMTGSIFSSKSTSGMTGCHLLRRLVRFDNFAEHLRNIF